MKLRFQTLIRWQSQWAKKNDLTESLFNIWARLVKPILNKKLGGLFEKKNWGQVFNKNKPKEGCDEKICFFFLQSLNWWLRHEINSFFVCQKVFKILKALLSDQVLKAKPSILWILEKERNGKYWKIKTKNFHQLFNYIILQIDWNQFLFW